MENNIKDRGHDLLVERRNRLKVRIILTVSLVVLAVFLMFVSILAGGSSTLTFSDKFMGLFGQGSNSANIIIGNIRLRRAAAAIIVGFGLAISGASMQSSLKNPMASPSTLGVSEAATFGATLAILFLNGGIFNQGGSLSISNPYAVTIMAFLSALLAIFLVLALSKIRQFSPVVVALSGVAMGMFFQACTTLLQYFVNDVTLTSAVYWTFGDLTRATFSEIWIMLGVVGFSFVVLFFLSPRLNAIEEGDESARALGVNVPLVRLIALMLASLITAVCISFVGIIGFLGLVIPQVFRRFVGVDNRWLFPISGLGGTSVLLLCDFLSRTIMEGTNLPVGALTSIIGAPVFIYILLTSERRGHVS